MEGVNLSVDTKAVSCDHLGLKGWDKRRGVDISAHLGDWSS